MEKLYIWKNWKIKIHLLELHLKLKEVDFKVNISIMVGVDPTFTSITGMKVLEQIETPGLGTKIVEDPSNKTNPFWFPEQFGGVQYISTN